MLSAVTRTYVRGRPTVAFFSKRTCFQSRPTRFGIGDLTQTTKSPNREELVPGSLKRDPFLDTLEARDHIHWLMQKNALGQDMLFMGGICLKRGHLKTLSL